VKSRTKAYSHDDFQPSIEEEHEEDEEEYHSYRNNPENYTPVMKYSL